MSKDKPSMCSCCRCHLNSDDQDYELFCGTYDAGSGNSLGIFAPVCEACFEATQVIQKAFVKGEISRAEYRLYENALYRALAHGMLVDAFVRNPKLQNALSRLRVLEY